MSLFYSYISFPETTDYTKDDK